MKPGYRHCIANAELSKGTAEEIEVITADTIVMEAPKRNA